MQPVKPLKEKVSLTLDADILEQLRPLADEDGRQLSPFINLILRDYLRSLPREKPGKVPPK